MLQSISLDTTGMEWGSAHDFYGDGATFGGRDIVRLKLLSDRRAEGGGVAFLVRFIPPEGKVIRIIAVARSDEHIFDLEGGRGTKGGEQLRFPGQYGLNPNGKPHSAFIATESVALVVYTGEPDQIRSLDVIDKA